MLEGCESRVMVHEIHEARCFFLKTGLLMFVLRTIRGIVDLIADPHEHNSHPKSFRMNISLKLFAKARELAGESQVLLDVPEGATVAMLRQALIRSFPQLGDMSEALLWAVNNEYVTPERRLDPADDVACFPPVSGG